MHFNTYLLSNQKIKEKILDLLIRETESKITEIRNEIKELESSRNSETKSTAGDKHEVGRAMAQSELENLSKRLVEVKERHSRLKQIDLSPSSMAKSGSLVVTSNATYFIAVGQGKIEVEKETFFVVSPASPIGQVLLDKKSGDKISFRNQEIILTAVY